MGHMIRVTYKTAMVLSMLEYILGKQGFQKGFQSFTENHFHKVGSLRSFQSEFEEVLKKTMDAFQTNQFLRQGLHQSKIHLNPRFVSPLWIWTGFSTNGSFKTWSLIMHLAT